MAPKRINRRVFVLADDTARVESVVSHWEWTKNDGVDVIMHDNRRYKSFYTLHDLKKNRISEGMVKELISEVEDS